MPRPPAAKPLATAITRALLLGVAAAACLGGGCGESPGVEVASAREIGVVAQSPLIVGRDGGYSARLWDHSVWLFGDTVVSVPDAASETWHHNSAAWTQDLQAADGLGGFGQAVDEAGAPTMVIPPNPAELAYNLAHKPDATGACAAAPCGGRLAIWPGPVVWDAAGQRALVAYALIQAAPGAFNFASLGCSYASWAGLGAPVERPDVAPGSAHPSLLFPAPGPRPCTAAIVEGGLLYALDCDTPAGFARPCRLARVPLTEVFVRSAWRFWSGSTWTAAADGAEAVFDGAPMVSLARWTWPSERYAAVYSDPLSDDVVLRTAPALTGPWSDELRLFTSTRKTNGGWTYDALQHAEYQQDGGRVLFVSYSRPTGQGWFGAELALWRVDLRLP